MPKLVISQPNFLPWRGMFEQIKLCDTFVFYDDVQLPKGGGRGRGFVTRVQIKTEKGQEWLSVPVERTGSGLQLIKDARFADMKWKKSHLSRIIQAYKTAPFFEEIFETLVSPVYSYETEFLSDFCINSMKSIFRMLGISVPVYLSSQLAVPMNDDASFRVLDFCRFFRADAYITGHGAANYLRHDIFEDAGVKVEYIDYRLTPYPQLHGNFIPYVSIIDLFFNVGPQAAEYLDSGTVYWKEWLEKR